MRRRRGSHPIGFGRNAFAGYTDFRYGSPSTVTLAGRKHKPILPEGKRKAMVGRVAEVLQDWSSSPFENEGAIRHGLREAFCLEGHEWQRAEKEAEHLTEAAIRSLGLERPSWIEGQPDYAGECDYCSWCKGPIDDEGRSRRQRFCCGECATMAIEQRSKLVEKHDGGIRRSAFRLVSREKAPLRPCQHCGEPFKSERTTALYCSPVCTSHGVLGDRLVPDITCEGCGKVGKPANRGARFCSLTCRSATVHNERRKKLQAVTMQCAECGDSYSPKSERDRFCSNRCASRERNRQYRARKGQAAVFAYTCHGCGIGFTANKPRSPFCGKPCADLVQHVETGKAKRLVPRVFDYVMDPPIIPASRVLVERLFAA